ncbi:MAG: hypothetical protein M1832_000213 [Thelocarpon impressellum]|nr:MAG: hypothetical protein M1832_000213 [Thelocarpon impressellum]
MSNGSVTTVIGPAADSPIPANALPSSVSSVSSASSWRHEPWRTSHAYKQTSTLFLTRRLAEALSTIEPIVTREPSPDEHGAEGVGGEAPPIASASRTSRIKVWSLYLTLLDAIINLDPDEGRSMFGSRRRRELISKVREGGIWEEVVRDGYGGVEGSVDVEVVINLATLLLSHAPSQTLNQQRLENYLSALATPELDVSARLQSEDGRTSAHRRPTAHGGGTDTPRDLDSRIKLLELYTLHVLPRNEEWEYAREFIGVSEVLDDERREAFLQMLGSLCEAEQQSAQALAELAREQDAQLAREKKAAAAARDAETVRVESQTSHRRTGSETDYGIESAPPGGPARAKPKAAAAHPAAGGGTRLSPTGTAAAPKKTKSPPATLYRRAAVAMANWQEVLAAMARSLKTNPLALLRMLAFLAGLLAVLSRPDVRERVRRVAGAGWAKVRGTVGMGVKVSYI